MSDETATAPHPFERHALILLGLVMALMLLVLVLVAPARVDAVVLLAGAVPSVLLVGAAIWGLATRQWWAAAAAVGVFAAIVVQGIVELAASLYNGGLTIPISAIIAGLVLWIDRPSLTARGVPVAWTWAALYAATYLVGLVVSLSAVQGAR